MDIEDKLSFLDGDKMPSQAPVAEASPATEPEKSIASEQPRDESGKFTTPKVDEPKPEAAAADPQPEAGKTPEPAPTPEPPKQEHVPLPVFLDMRDENKDLKRRLKEYEQRQSQPQQVPSASEDPEGYAAYVEGIATQTRINTRFEMSEALARDKHGDDSVQAAMDWAMEQAQKSPAFAGEYLQQKHPIDWAVKQQKRHALMQTIGDDPEAYIAAEIAKRLAAQTPAPEPQPTPAAVPQQAAIPAPAAPAAPRSIANQPAAGTSQHVQPAGPGTAFEAAFPS